LLVFLVSSEKLELRIFRIKQFVSDVNEKKEKEFVD